MVHTQCSANNTDETPDFTVVVSTTLLLNAYIVYIQLHHANIMQMPVSQELALRSGEGRNLSTYTLPLDGGWFHHNSPLPYLETEPISCRVTFCKFQQSLLLMMNV